MEVAGTCSMLMLFTRKQTLAAMLHRFRHNKQRQQRHRHRVLLLTTSLTHPSLPPASSPPHSPFAPSSRVLSRLFLQLFHHCLRRRSPRPGSHWLQSADRSAFSHSHCSSQAATQWPLLRLWNSHSLCVGAANCRRQRHSVRGRACVALLSAALLAKSLRVQPTEGSMHRVANNLRRDALNDSISLALHCSNQT
jgi:hypothetical protein